MIDQDLFSLLQKACLAAGKIQLEYYDKKIEISSKEIAADLVTEVDLKSQSTIIESLTQSMLEAGFKKEEVGFIGEEGVNDQAKYLFIIDPLDGTSNYVEKTGQFCISIAYLEGEEILAGIVYQPTEDTFYFAEKNRGAFQIKNGEKTELRIQEVRFEDAVGAFNSSSWPEILEKVTSMVSKLEKKIKEIKKSRSAILTALSVTTNKNNLAINGRTKLWDIAAAKLIIEEAGGIMSDWRGEELAFEFKNLKKSYQFIVTQRNLLGQIIEIIQ